MNKARDRIETLLVDETTDKLSGNQQKELAKLLATHADVDRHAFERAAATVFLASQGIQLTAMPRALYSKIVTDAKRSIEEGN